MITGLEAHLGPFPYRTLTVALLPDYGGGIEYPSMIFEASPSPQVLVHEVAHMWFYGMVGNSQFGDPWLDEAFASWAETVVDGDEGLVDRRAISLDGPVGGSMAAYPDDHSYVTLVYDKGGAALLAARDAAGPAAFRRHHPLLCERERVVHRHPRTTSVPPSPPCPPPSRRWPPPGR